MGLFLLPSVSFQPFYDVQYHNTTFTGILYCVPQILATEEINYQASVKPRKLPAAFL